MKQSEYLQSGGISKGFWNRKAAGYPRPFDEKSFAATSRLISLVRDRGVIFRGADILDIGCGTGTHALPLAREAGSVTGVDNSPVMIDVMTDEISRHGFQNVRAVCCDWGSMDVAGNGFAGAFDIVWTSMSPAVRSREDLMRMESCSRKWCVYIGWGRKRENSLLKTAFELHGLAFGPPPGALSIGKILSARSRIFSIDFTETSWDWSGTVDAAVEDVAGFIEMAGRPADREKLLEMLSDRQQDGLICHTTEVEEGILVWKV